MKLFWNPYSNRFNEVVYFCHVLHFQSKEEQINSASKFEHSIFLWISGENPLVNHFRFCLLHKPGQKWRFFVRMWTYSGLVELCQEEESDERAHDVRAFQEQRRPPARAAVSSRGPATPAWSRQHVSLQPLTDTQTQTHTMPIQDKAHTVVCRAMDAAACPGVKTSI